MPPLESVLATRELERRPRRPPDHAAENRALIELSRHLVVSPGDILQRLVEETLVLCGADSAGLSLIEESEDGRHMFRWPAIAGAFAPNVRGTTPRDFSPCGIVVDTNQTQLFVRPAEHYSYFEEASPPIVEALLHPFPVDGKPSGTIWVLSHDENKRFDAEDARVLADLATLAANAYQILSALEESRKADRRKEEFLAQLSHEMRSPLQTVMIGVRTLTQPAKLPKDVQQRLAGAVERGLHSLTRMVDDLLEISRIREGKVSLEVNDADLAMIVRDVVDGYRDAARDAKLELSLTLEPSIPARVDGTRLHQIVGNLLSNAIKFTPAGGRISVAARQAADGAEITVRDTGEGIQSAVLPTIFEKFVQGDTSITRHSGGLGLGLAIARHLVELHGGSIEARSEGEGKGATLRVHLPSVLAH